ncbi:MAG: type III-B CRISPR-associated protein Cas10/Cmr2 [Pontiella sp.]
MSKMLLKVQIGPVQEFIIQARSTRDMWAGSYLLSWLTASTMKVFKDADCEFIFPTLEKQPLYNLFCGNPSKDLDAALIPTLPNVFMLLVPEDQVENLAKEAKAALKNELQTIGEACWGEMMSLGASKVWKLRWDDQLNAFPLFNWSAIPVSNDWKTDVENLGKQMAARRNTREFKSWNGVAGATKDILSGKEESIGSEEFWSEENKKNQWNKAGPYGAMNCIKRLFPDAYLQPKFGNKKMFWNEASFESTRTIANGNSPEKGHNPYFAVIAMDGDRMGKALQKLRSKEEHTQFSRTLAQFAENGVSRILTQFEFEQSAQLVYAGGDDVLVMCPADQALELAEALRNEFIDTMHDYIDPESDEKMDASCGIAVGHYQFPLQRIVEEARAAEHRAKNKRGRAAFALSLLKRSGEIIHWGAKWDSNALDVYKDFTEKSAGASPCFSGRFPYALAELLQPYRLGGKSDPQVAPEVLKKIIEKEFLHVQERQAQKKNAVVGGALDYLAELPNDQLEDFPNLFLASAFMNRQRGEN